MPSHPGEHRAPEILPASLKLTVRLVAVTATFVFAGLPAGAQDAQTVLSRMSSAYVNARTFDGTFRVSQTGRDSSGKTGSMTTVQRIRFQVPNLFLINLSISGTGAGAPPKGTISATSACNGKQIYNYSPNTNQFMQAQAPPRITFPALLMQLKLGILPGPKTPGASFLPAKTYAGRPAYMIQVKPVVPPGVPANMRAAFASPYIFAVDRHTYALLSLSHTAGPAVQNIQTSNQKFNGVVPASLFNWRPPAGAKERKQQAPPMAPGQPPAPQGGRRP